MSDSSKHVTGEVGNAKKHKQKDASRWKKMETTHSNRATAGNHRRINRHCKLDCHREPIQRILYKSWVIELN
jgi:hypothetical protein